MTLDEIKELIKFAKEQGVNHFKNGEIEIRLQPQFIVVDGDKAPEPTDEDLLFHSSSN